MVNKYFNAENHKKAIIKWIQDWFKQNGSDCKAVIGISGGKDSTVAAALCVEALGKENVFGVLMPCDYQEDIADSYAIVEFLGIDFMTVNIGLPVDSLLCAIAYPRNGKGATISDQTRINLPPRIRMATLYAISQSINGRVCCTDNLSESYIGYSTRWGDGVGDFAPLADLTSEEVVAIGDALGLPQELVHKTPSDGLCGKTDEDSFGFSYDELNRYIRIGECRNIENTKLIEQKHLRNLFKTQPIPKYHSFENEFKW
jgi:NAD+ synthase